MLRPVSHGPLLSAVGIFRLNHPCHGIDVEVLFNLQAVVVRDEMVSRDGIVGKALRSRPKLVLMY